MEENIDDVTVHKQSDTSNKKRKSVNKKWSSKKKAKSSDSTEEYEVEKLVDHKTEDGKEFYMVQWKGWDEKYNSWVAKEDLFCQELVEEFHQTNPIKKDSNMPNTVSSDLTTEELQKYIESIYKPTHEDAEFAVRLVCSSAAKLKLNGTKSILSDEDLHKLTVKVYRKKQQLLLMEKGLMTQLLLRDLRKRRTEQMEVIQRWEAMINLATQGHPTIKVENNVDLEEPPMGFTYTTHRKAGEGVVIPDDPLIGCECSDCHEKGKSCCGPLSGSQAAYTKNGRLKVPVGTPIYECNKRCLCGPDCYNRVLQRGSKIKLCIFRTNNGRGWGVKSLESIKKNTFVIEYVGEVITNEEAEKRGLKYDSEGRTYLFDLDFNDADCMYSVDAAFYGNAAHFINHSCDPNLAVFAIWVDCLDPNMPRLGLFAQRDIHAGEELTFDYGSSNTSFAAKEQGVEDGSPGETSTKNQCRCGATNCRKIMFSLPETQAISSFPTIE